MPQTLHVPAARQSDSYKVSHNPQYPRGTSEISSYLEARAGARFDKTVFFGLQYILRAYMAGRVISARQLARDEAFFGAHFFGDSTIYNKAGWSRIVENHGGRLPLSIRAVPEGTTLGNSNVLMTVKNLDPSLPWLPNYFETILLHTWYGSTVASLSRGCKEVWYKFLEKTGDPAGIAFKHHDFGFRGVETIESAAVGGAGHLINFSGTDNLAAIELILQYYSGTNSDEIDAMTVEDYREFVQKNMKGFSIPASEHSTITSWGEKGEVDAYRNMLKSYPKGFVACVSDSWDIDRACAELWGNQLKAEVLERDGVLVIRPDSGEPTEVLPRIMQILGKAFGFEKNSKGFKVLNSKVRVIQGDGVEYDTVDPILSSIVEDGWSADNLAMGSGGGLLQKVNRDTQRMAFKCSHAVIDGKGVDVFKRPATDPTKNSKKGYLALVVENGEYKTVALDDAKNFPGGDQLVEVFNSGDVLQDYLFDDIRRRAELPELLVPAAV